MKQIKGEKYIYLLMAYKIVERNKDLTGEEIIEIGFDNGMVGGQHSYRRFELQNYDNKILLIERKNGRNFAEYSRTFEIIDKGGKLPIIKPYVNEYDEDGSKWRH